MRFASSIIAHSSPFISMPASAKRSGSTRRSSLPSSGRPSELASRFAGSIVSTATFLPRRRHPSAIAAEVVVLPTPPEPAQMQIALALEQLADVAAIRPIAPVASSVDRVHVELGLEQERQLDRRLAGLLEALELLALRRAACRILASAPPGRRLRGRRRRRSRDRAPRCAPPRRRRRAPGRGRS